MAPRELDVVAVVLQVHDAFEELFARDFLPNANGNHHRFVILLAAYPVNAGHAATTTTSGARTTNSSWTNAIARSLRCDWNPSQ